MNSNLAIYAFIRGYQMASWPNIKSIIVSPMVAAALKNHQDSSWDTDIQTSEDKPYKVGCILNKFDIFVDPTAQNLYDLRFSTNVGTHSVNLGRELGLDT